MFLLKSLCCHGANTPTGPLYALENSMLVSCIKDVVIHDMTIKVDVAPTTVDALRGRMIDTNGKLPFTHRVFNWPIVLQLGYPLFIGPHLLKGHPDNLPDALWGVLESRLGDDLQNGPRHEWLASPPLRFGDVAIV